MTAYYNEIDEYAASWLRNLIAAGLIAPGVVDTRSIEDVCPADLVGFTQCHFFAGIGGWSLALRAAGVPDDYPIWTGSCPCQPFSAAGEGEGFADERHLWPHFFHLIGQRLPARVVGEQVASKDAEPWVDLVRADLEGLGYAFGAVAFPSAGVGAPHIRDRSYWGAVNQRLDHADHRRLEGHRGGHQTTGRHGQGSVRPVAAAGESVRLANANGEGRRDGWQLGRGDDVGFGAAAAERSIGGQGVEGLRIAGGMAHSSGERLQGIGLPVQQGQQGSAGAQAGRGSEADRMADADGRHASAEREQCGGQQRFHPQHDGAVRGPGGGREDCAGSGMERPGPVNGFWSDADWLFCRDGKWRPVEAGTFPLAHGLPRSVGSGGAGVERLAGMAGLDGASLARAKQYRVGALRGYGNAINIEAAVAFADSFLCLAV